MNIIEHFLKAVELYPSKTAIIHHGKSISYQELDTKIQELSSYFTQKNIKRGDSIMVVVPFSIDLYVCILALFNIGAKVVLVDSLFPKSRLQYAFSQADCKFIITVPFLKAVKLFTFPLNLFFKIKGIKLIPANHQKQVELNEEDTALITLTSGTTGKPKLANRTHQFLNIQLETLIDEMKLTHHDHHLTSLPVVLMCNLAVGACSIIPPKSYFRTSKISDFENSDINLLSGSPSHILNFTDWINPEKIRQVFVGGATILPNFVERIKNKLDLAKLKFVYGSTEAEPIATISAIEYLSNINRMGICVGEIHKNIQVKIWALDQEKELADGAIGEIICAGNHVLSSYYNGNENLENKIEYQNILWHKTGDLGYLHQENLYFLGRKKYSWYSGTIFCSPLIFEKILAQKFPTLVGTVLQIDQKHILYINSKDPKLIQEITASFTVQIDKVKYVDKFPKDKRHQSRIDYEKLLKMR